MMENPLRHCNSFGSAQLSLVTPATKCSLHYRKWSNSLFKRNYLTWDFSVTQVEIQKGRDKGKQGIVCQIIKERNWCYVEGLNYKYDTMNKSATNPGTMVRVEQPLLVTTEVSLVDPSDEKATTIQWRYTEEGERVRVSTRTGRIIPLSRDTQYADPEDGVNTLDFKETDKDTTEAVLSKITFEPKLKTFEQDLMDEYGIKEDRQKAPTFYY